MMRRHATIKFGAQTADRLAAILGADPTAERMDQVGVAIMECVLGHFDGSGPPPSAAMRSPRAWRVRTLNSGSAMFSQLRGTPGAVLGGVGM